MICLGNSLHFFGIRYNPITKLLRFYKTVVNIGQAKIAGTPQRNASKCGVSISAAVGDAGSILKLTFFGDI